MKDWSLKTLLERLLNGFSVSSDKVRATFGAIALVIFCIGFLLAWLRSPDVIGDIRLQYLGVLILLLLPVVAILNGLRFYVTAQAVRPCTFARAIVVAVFSTAANLLPIPGGMLVRMANLRGPQNRVMNALAVTVLTAGLSAAVTVSMAAAAYLAFEDSALSRIVFVAGIVTLAAILIVSAFSAIKPSLMKLLFVEVAAVFVEMARIAVCFRMLGIVISPQQSLVLTASGVAGSAVSIVPAGLGVKELTAAAIALLVSLSPSATFIALSLNRLAGLAFFMILTLPISFYRDRTRKGVA